MTAWCHSTRPPQAIRPYAIRLLFPSYLCFRLQVSIGQASTNLIWITRSLEHASGSCKSAWVISGELVCQLHRSPYCQEPGRSCYKDRISQGKKHGGCFLDEGSDLLSNTLIALNVLKFPLGYFSVLKKLLSHFCCCRNACKAPATVKGKFLGSGMNRKNWSFRIVLQQTKD